MQQTQTYKLNKPGVDDPMAIAPLNENMDKVEGALAAQDARIVTLENCRMVIGQYCGTGPQAEQIINLGERPVAVLASAYTPNLVCGMLAVGDALLYGTNHKALKIVDNGFWVSDAFNYPHNEGYCYLAFFGDYPVKNVNYPKGA